MSYKKYYVGIRGNGREWGKLEKNIEMYLKFAVKCLLFLLLLSLFFNFLLFFKYKKVCESEDVLFKFFKENSWRTIE